MIINYNGSQIEAVQVREGVYRFLSNFVYTQDNVQFAANIPMVIEASASKPSGGFRRIMLKCSASLPHMTAFTGGGASGGVITNSYITRTQEYSFHVVLKVPVFTSDAIMRLGGMMPVDGYGNMDPNLGFCFLAIQRMQGLILTILTGSAPSELAYGESTVPDWLETAFGRGSLGYNPLLNSDTYGSPASTGGSGS